MRGRWSPPRYVACLERYVKAASTIFSGTDGVKWMDAGFQTAQRTIPKSAGGTTPTTVHSHALRMKRQRQAACWGRADCDHTAPDWYRYPVSRHCFSMLAQLTDYLTTDCREPVHE
jgi:hypothetical protein